MVDLPLMARLLDAMRPAARLVLVGDPDQLASVEAGTVLADVAAGGALAERVFDVGAPPTASGPDSGIAALAEAMRTRRRRSGHGAADSGPPATCPGCGPDETGPVASVEARVIDAARLGVAGSARRRSAAGARSGARRSRCWRQPATGRIGAHDWSRRIEEGVAARAVRAARGPELVAGRPVMVTANDPLLGVANGDTGVVVTRGDGLLVALDSGAGDVHRCPRSDWIRSRHGGR